MSKVMEGELPGIAVLRGVAAIMVFAGAMSFSSTWLESLGLGVRNPLHVGVELLFVLSGYLAMRSVQSGVTPGAFLVGRLFRLWPVLVVGCLAAMISMMVMSSSETGPWAQQFFTVPMERLMAAAGAVLTGSVIPGGGAMPYQFSGMWSGSVIIQAGAVVLLVLALTHALRMAGLGEHILGGLAVAVLAIGMVGRVLQGLGLDITAIDYLVQWRFDFVALGMVIGAQWHVVESWGRGVNAWAGAALVSGPAIVLAFAEGAGSGSIGAALALMMTAAAFGLAVVMAVSGRLVVRDDLVARALSWVGARGFAAYVLLYPCMSMAWLIMASIDVGLVEDKWSYAWLQPLVTLGLLLPLAEIVHRAIERPMTVAGRSLSGDRGRA